MGPPIREPLEPHSRYDLGGPGPRLCPRPVPETEADIVRDGEMREEGVALEDVSDMATLGRQINAGLGIEEHAAVHHDAARIRLEEPCHALERQRLARARRTEE